MSGNINKEKVMIHIKTEREGIGTSLFGALIGGDADDLLGEELSPEEELILGIIQAVDAKNGFFVRSDENSESDAMEFYSGGVLTDNGKVYTLTYEETELTGLEGSVSCVTFKHDDPTLITLTRSGMVETSMTFKPHHRIITSYQTPYMPFEIGVHCLMVDNRLSECGKLCLDYIIEVRGAKAERCIMELDVKTKK